MISQELLDRLFSVNSIGGLGVGLILALAVTAMLAGTTAAIWGRRWRGRDYLQVGLIFVLMTGAGILFWDGSFALTPSYPILALVGIGLALTGALTIGIRRIGQYPGRSEQLLLDLQALADGRKTNHQ